MSNESLDKINGPGAADEIARIRTERAAAEQLRREMVSKGLADVATPAGVVSPDESLVVHSGEVPTVVAGLAESETPSEGVTIHAPTAAELMQRNTTE